MELVHRIFGEPAKVDEHMGVDREAMHKFFAEERVGQFGDSMMFSFWNFMHTRLRRRQNCCQF